jgi:hypothetical protein
MVNAGSANGCCFYAGCRGTAARFISHAGADRAWAEWIGWQLLGAGLEVEPDCWAGARATISSRR